MPLSYYYRPSGCKLGPDTALGLIPAGKERMLCKCEEQEETLFYKHSPVAVKKPIAI